MKLSLVNMLVMGVMLMASATTCLADGECIWCIVGPPAANSTPHTMWSSCWQPEAHREWIKPRNASSHSVARTVCEVRLPAVHVPLRLLDLSAAHMHSPCRRYHQALTRVDRCAQVPPPGSS
jgi:hypothetical protein